MSASLSPTGTADTITAPPEHDITQHTEQDEDDPMAEDRRSPTARRRRLSAELETLIKGAGLDAVKVDESLHWTRGKTAKMLRGAWRLPSLRDIRDILDLLKIADGDPHRDYLLTLARQGREKDWWHDYQSMLSDTFTTYLGLETEAQTIYTFEQGVFHGLTQTADYARAIMRNGPTELDDDAIEERVHVRLERQKLLTEGKDPLRLWTIIDEAVLRRVPIDDVNPDGELIKSGAQIMREQLQRIRELAGLARVTVQVVPFTAGLHAGMSGPFTILEYAETASDVAYTENLAGQLMLQKTEDLKKFRNAHEKLKGVALDPRTSLAFIAEVAADLT
ncbi:DUF5753 domain-containing protein [Actinomadura sp. GTD37]|uniref:DUF5753 domain-containing protein n=1 Tax=Actinomadura sp. GTD37 TaxID=1778030 RepID=UPI0035C107BB